MTILSDNANPMSNVPEPAQPTVAAPAPMNLAAESISRVTAVVWNDRICGRRATGVVFWAANVWLWLMTALLNGRMKDPLSCRERKFKEKPIIYATIEKIKNAALWMMPVECNRIERKTNASKIKWISLFYFCWLWA